MRLLFIYFLLNPLIFLGQQTASYYFDKALEGNENNFQYKVDNLSKAIDLNPQMAEAYYYRAVAKENLGEDACEDFYRACGYGYTKGCDRYNSNLSKCRFVNKSKTPPRFAISIAGSNKIDTDLRISIFPKKTIGFYIGIKIPYEYHSNYYSYAYNYNNHFSKVDWISSWSGEVYYDDAFPVINNSSNVISTVDANGDDMSIFFPNGGLSYDNTIIIEKYRYYSGPQIGVIKSIKEKLWISFGIGYVGGLEVLEKRNYYNTLTNELYGEEWFWNSDRGTSEISFQLSVAVPIKKHLLLRYGIYNISDFITHEFGIGFTFRTIRKRAKI